ncbi:hypothetical protein CLAIMM_02449 [Cladophialophora immunda]|nr:hypothetical protein CLAIMM_02449 [Cladophialophora immunda]
MSTAHPDDSMVEAKRIEPVQTNVSIGDGDGKDVREVRLKQNFNLFTTLGVTFSITAVPLAIGGYLNLVVGLGGAPAYFWCFIVAAVFQFVVCLSIAELASGLPHPAGPAYWVKVLAPPRYSKLCEYLVSWWTNVAWMCICAVSNLYVAFYIVAIAAVLNPSYVVAPWHTYLANVAVSLVALAVNLPGLFKAMPYIMGTAVLSINGTALFILITSLARASPKQSASVVFVDFVNDSGWDSMGTVFFLALLPGLASLGAFDTAVHLADEVPAPSKQIPQVMLGSFGLSALGGLVMILVLSFCNTDPASLLAPVGGMGFVQFFVNAFRSTALVVVATVLTIVVLTICTANCLTSWSRLYWSVSQDAMIPFHSWTARLSGRARLPVHALLVGTLFANAITAIYCGNSVATNAILGCVALLSTWSFILALVLLLVKGRDRALPEERYLNLGRWGFAINVLSIVWCVFIVVWLSMPLYLPVTAESMNYTSVVSVGFTVIAGLYWVFVYAKRKVH